MKATLYTLLLVVAAAAAVLSFTTLRDLALLCGFSISTAWLLPLVVDVGAAAGTLTWLSGPGAARGYGRALALTLLGLSVGGNALGHGLAAADARPHWGVVVLVSAVAPAVLGAVVHLSVLAGRTDPAEHDQAEEPTEQARMKVVSEPVATVDPVPAVAATVGELVEQRDGTGRDRVSVLLAEGAGRRRLARELDITEHQARELIAERRERVAV
nr:DUF2637 domain-containing protein [Pseudonocardia sp. AL041005-10]